MSALSKIRSSRAIVAFGPSPRLVAHMLLYVSAPLTVISVAAKAYPLTADYFNRNVCVAPPKRSSYDPYSYPVTKDTDCVSADEHRDLMFGIPTSISIGIFAALFVLGIIYMMTLVHEYRKTAGTVRQFSRKRVIGYDLMMQIATTLILGLALVAAYFGLLGAVSLFEAFIAMNNDMASETDTSSY